ncbi:cellular nucleic acid-binding protein homolog [Solenopsis invicta]|uniref:cellular nucleic acid-binding protein homolog n=1 Tax=Solenopsis invicta TaxID=13686 RepID=UPI000595C563|nr:cellular nucleic acid-binding protein homolog [Solenopsis invicta]
MARIEALRPRPAQCYRCLRTGHTIGNCGSPVDRSNLCYRCGQPDHVASNCEEAFRCPVCADLGRPAGHRFGGPACTPPPSSQKGGCEQGGQQRGVGGA